MASVMNGSLFSKSTFSDLTGQQDYVILLFFPFHISWCEILLRVFSGAPASPSPLTAVLAASGTGAIFGALICLIRRRHILLSRILQTVFAAAYVFLFAVESMLRSIFDTYMTPANILSGAGAVMKNYTCELLRSIPPGILRFLLFMLPALAMLTRDLLHRRKTAGTDPFQEHPAAEAEGLPPQNQTDNPLTPTNAAAPENAPAAYEGAVSQTPLCLCILYCGAGILLILCSVFYSHNSRAARFYGSGYSYNAAADAFGLVTATRLDVQYGMFGNPYTSFSSADTGFLSGDSKNPGNAAGTPGGTETADDAAGKPGGTETADAAAGKPGGTETADAAAGKPGGPETADAVPEGTAQGTGDSKKTEQAPAAGESGTAETAAADDAPAAESAKTEKASEKPDEPAYNIMNLDFSLPELNRTKQLSQLSSYLSSRKPSLKNKYTGPFAGKNLILVCAESYCDRFIRPELTPTLWRLTHNGFYFAEYYQSEWGGSTTTGELAFTTGLCGNNGDDSLSGIAGNNHYFTMGNQLQRLGYSSIAFHSGSHTYYKRHTTHENLGYNQFLASGNGLEELTYAYAADTDLIDVTTPLYIDHQPFSVYYMTLSGHAPYVSNSFVKKYYDLVDSVVGDEYAKKTKYYICYQMELESAMTLLVQRLEEAGIADDTVIVLTGDHYPYGLGRGSAWKNDRDYIKDLIGGDDFFRWEQDRSGLIIWSGCLEQENKDLARTVASPVGNLDILPTLSNLFGVPFDSRLLPGRDVLAPDTEPMVFWNNFSVVVKEGKYDGRKLNWYPNEGYEWTAEDPDFLEDLHARVNDRLLMGRMIMQTDYYRLLFGADQVTQAGDLLWTPEKTPKEDN